MRPRRGQPGGREATGATVTRKQPTTSRTARKPEPKAWWHDRGDVAIEKEEDALQRELETHLASAHRPLLETLRDLRGQYRAAAEDARRAARDPVARARALDGWTRVGVQLREMGDALRTCARLGADWVEREVEPEEPELRRFGTRVRAVERTARDDLVGLVREHCAWLVSALGERLQPQVDPIREVDLNGRMVAPDAAAASAEAKKREADRRNVLMKLIATYREHHNGREPTGSELRSLEQVAEGDATELAERRRSRAESVGHKPITDCSKYTPAPRLAGEGSEPVRLPLYRQRSARPSTNPTTTEQRRARLTDAAERICAILKRHPSGLLKSEIMKHAGMSFGSASRAIELLVRGGVVRAEGNY